MPATDDEILNELKEIRKLLTPAAAPPKPKGLGQEFKAFLEQYKVLGLAVAFILGLYLGQLALGRVNDLIRPGIPIAPGRPGPLTTCTAGGPAVPAWQCLAVGPFLVGQFFGTLLTFIVVAVVIFLIVKAASKANLK